MLDRKTEAKRVRTMYTRNKDSVKNIAECRPIISMNKFLLQGLSNITTMQSGIINPNMQKELHRLLSGKGLFNWYYIKTRKETDLPRVLKFVYYKNDLSKTEPNQIVKIGIDKFKFYVYCIKTLSTDENGFYFIVNLYDVVKFINMINKENTESDYERRSRLGDYEKLEDITGAEEIKTTTDYEKIYSKLDSYERKLLFMYAKKAGIGKKERKLLKQIQKGGKTFNLYVEELEELIEELQEPETEEEKIRLEKAQKELIRLTEEDNTWSRMKTTLEDYEW